MTNDSAKLKGKLLAVTLMGDRAFAYRKKERREWKFIKIGAAIVAVVLFILFLETL